MKVDATDPRVEGLAKFLVGKSMVRMTGLGPVAKAMPDVITRATHAVWDEKNGPEDNKIKDHYRTEAADILDYLDKVAN